MALRLLERHFAPGLHEEILEAVGLELGTPIATRRRDMAFPAAVLEAHLADSSVSDRSAACELNQPTIPGKLKSNTPKMEMQPRR